VTRTFPCGGTFSEGASGGCDLIVYRSVEQSPTVADLCAEQYPRDLPPYSCQRCVYTLGPFTLNLVSAASVLSTIPVLIIFVDLQRFFVAGQTGGSTRGDLVGCPRC